MNKGAPNGLYGNPISGITGKVPDWAKDINSRRFNAANFYKWSLFRT
jgi:hypothetical protein